MRGERGRERFRGDVAALTNSQLKRKHNFTGQRLATVFPGLLPDGAPNMTAIDAERTLYYGLCGYVDAQVQICQPDQPR